MDIISMTDLIITNGALGWMGLRLVKRVDRPDRKADDHKTRIQLNERDLARGRHA